MPIKLKIGNRDGGRGSRDASASASSPGPSRNVSFSQQPAYAPAPEAEPQLQAAGYDDSFGAEQPALQSSSLTFPGMAPSPGTSSAAAAAPAQPSPTTTLQAAPLRPAKKRRPRSPTPPTTSHAHCLSLPSSSDPQHRNKRPRSTLASSSSSSSSSASFLAASCSSLPSTVRPSDALDLVIHRYARLAGYAAVQRDVLEVLRDWLGHYLDDLAGMAAGHAHAAGRGGMANAKDFLDAIVRMRRGDREGEEDDEEQREDEERGALHEYEREVDCIVDWRHRVPDYEVTPAPTRPGTPIDDPQPSPPRWARDVQPKLVQTLVKQGRTRPDVADQEEEEDDEATILLGEKTRRKEKTTRDEIPAHLPELPALHTWRKTDAYPSNRFLADDAGETGAGAADEEAGGAQESKGTAAGTASASGPLARLESRLLSSRLVQTSLSALIGRLDEAGMAAAAVGVAQVKGDSSTAARPAPAGPSSTATAAAATRHSSLAQSPRAAPSPTTGMQETTTAGPSSSPAQTPSTPAPGAAPRLSIRLRTSSSSQQQQGSADVSATSTPPSGVGGSGPGSTLSSSGLATALASRRSFAAAPPSLALDTASPSSSQHGRSLSLSWSRPGSRRGTLVGGPSPLGAMTPTTAAAPPGTPWGAPPGAASGWGTGGGGLVMSPVTPATAGGFAGAAGWGPSAGAGAGASTPAWPFFNSSTTAGGYGSVAGTPRGSIAVGAGEGSVSEGAGGVGEGNVMVTLPPVINFKQGWYGRKRGAGAA